MLLYLGKFFTMALKKRGSLVKQDQKHLLVLGRQEKGCIQKEKLITTQQLHLQCTYDINSPAMHLQCTFDVLAISEVQDNSFLDVRRSRYATTMQPQCNHNATATQPQCNHIAPKLRLHLHCPAMHLQCTQTWFLIQFLHKG